MASCWVSSESTGADWFTPEEVSERMVDVYAIRLLTLSTVRARTCDAMTASV